MAAKYLNKNWELVDENPDPKATKKLSKKQEAELLSKPFPHLIKPRKMKQ